MFNKKIAGLVIAMVVSAPFADAAKDCVKAAKAAYKTEMAGCKDMKGAEKKTCLKTAKTNMATAKAACKTPAAAPATEAAPATDAAPAN